MEESRRITDWPTYSGVPTFVIPDPDQESRMEPVFGFDFIFDREQIIPDDVLLTGKVY